MLAKNLFTTLRYCLALGLFLSFPVSAYAQETDAGEENTVVTPSDQTVVTTYASWRTICSGNPDTPDVADVCSLRREENVQFSNEFVFPLTIIMSSSENGIQMELSVPLGVDLRTGIVLQADNEELESLPFVLCRSDNCLALGIFERDAFLEGVENKDELQIFFSSFNAPKPYAITWPLAGFVEAYESIF